MNTSKGLRRLFPWLQNLFFGHPNYIPTGWIGFRVSNRTVDDTQKLLFLYYKIELVHLSNRWCDGQFEIRQEALPHCTKSGEMIWFRIIHGNGKPIRLTRVKKYEEYVATLARELREMTADVPWVLKTFSSITIRTKERFFLDDKRTH